MKPTPKLTKKAAATMPPPMKKRTPFLCTKSEIETYQCLSCKRFRTQFLTSLKQHYREGHEQHNFITPPQRECSKCHLKTYSRYLLLRHTFFDNCKLKTDSEAPKVESSQKDSAEDEYMLFYCLYCSYKSTSQQHLLSHVSKEHTSGTNEYECKTYSKPKFQNQIKLPHGSRKNCNFKYKYADHKANHQYNLKVQVFSNTSESEIEDDVEIRPTEKVRKVYRCSHCPYGCWTKSKLPIHVKENHPDQAWYSCKNCQFKCATKYELSTHNNVHTEKENQRVQICNIEPDIITERNDLQCELCMFIAHNKSELFSHIKKEHFSDVF